MRLKDKVSLITGAAAGIGEACARTFAAEGAKVVIADVDARGKALAAQLGAKASFVHLDVSSPASFAAAIEHAVRTFGRLDILVNNAGIALPAAAVQDTSDEEFDRLININLRGVFNGCKLAYKHLKATKGNVLNISSMSGVTGQERHAIYAATKGAINALTKSAAVDWGSDGIRINALCPTGVWTDTLRMWADQQPNKADIESYLNRIHSLGYCPGPEAVAPVAAFLCSDEAKFITGCIMPVSGGSECGYKL
jgi:meso-butanediol dehydrogenase / (S,S)-butanediol dehydrogenase / diacetyl reductase